MKKTNKNELELTTNSYYNLQNVYEVVLNLGVGSFTFEELILTIDQLFVDLSRAEKKDLAIKTLQIIKIIN